MTRTWKFDLAGGLDRLPEPGGKRSTTLFEHGTMRLLVYAPRGTDPQQPHEQDEIYVVMRGAGTFFVDGDRVPFGPGDALFVPAGLEHRFEDFDDDLALWVVFWGAKGGEVA